MTSSTGAKEQIAVLSRLACLTLVDPIDGVPLIADDAMGFSDAHRLPKVCHALGNAELPGQVIIVTCDPTRFSGVPNATWISMT